ncbi:MAG: DUF1475 domain-containing protein [Acidimicrobiia bacterium]
MRIVGLIGLAVMAVALAHGFAAGDFIVEGAVLGELAWGRVSLADIYTGVFVFGCWIVWRERSFVKAAPWLIALVVLGNFGIAPYLLWISRSSSSTAEALVGRER